jgi:O-antigen/teichoic acid export membrane protein
MVASSPLITRLYSPDDFGVLSIYVSLLSLMMMVASWRYDRALLLPHDNQMAANLLGLSLIIALGMSFLLGIAVWLFGTTAVEWLKAPSLGPYLWLLPFGFLALGAYQALSSWAIRKRQFTQLAQTKVTQSIGQVVVQVGLGVFNAGSTGLLVGDVIGRSSGSGRLAALIWQTDRTVLSAISVDGMLQAAHRFRRFPILSSSSAILNGIGAYLPALLIAANYGVAVAGWYALTQRVLGVPLTFLAASVGDVYTAESASIGRENSGGQLRLFSKTLRGLLVVGVGVVMLVAVPAPLLFGLVFGGGWSESANYVQIMAPMFLLQFVGSPLLYALDVLERQDLQVAREALRLILTCGPLVAAASLTVSVTQALAMLSIGGSISYVVAILLVRYAISVTQERSRRS